MRLDIRDRFPSGMEEYLAQNGWHFNKEMCKWATSRMSRKEGKIQGFSKTEIEALFAANKAEFDVKYPYDAIYVANICKADFFGSSIVGDANLVKFVQDYINDADGYEEMAFTRFYADCIGCGVAIPWEDVL